jgi:hypothetical protein
MDASVVDERNFYFGSFGSLINRLVPICGEREIWNPREWARYLTCASLGESQSGMLQIIVINAGIFV